MKILCILVTGVGAVIGQGILLSLKHSHQDYKARLIGLDRRDSPFARKICDKTYIKPSKDERTQVYSDFLLELLQKEQVDVVLPGIESDVYYFDEHRELFAKSSRLALNTHALIAAARDKYNIYSAIQKNALPAIPTRTGGCWADCLAELGPAPLLLKPRQGSGSRGLVFLENEEDFVYWTNKTKGNFLIQRIVGCDDEEYTASIFGFGDGTSIAPIIFRRRLSPSGFTCEAQVMTDSECGGLVTLIEKLTALFSPLGPTNYQFRKAGSDYYLLEINPRISSATSIRAAFGYNEAWMSARYYGLDIVPQTPVIRPGHAVRCTRDYIEYAE